jgi:Acetyltransferase (GNAT) domain
VKEQTGRSLYESIEYARAFGFGCLEVEEWGTALVTREIPGTNWRDAVGCYPLAAIDRNADLVGGLNRLRAAGLVSVALVPDPMTSPALEKLTKAFSICRVFKTHYVIDRSLARPPFPQTHRRWMRKAARMCIFARVELREKLADWMRLYDLIVARHGIEAIQRFSPAYFAALAQMSEVEAFSATVEGRIVAMALWVRSGEVVYYHLGASDEEGYRTQAMYGIFAAADEYLRDYPLIHLGGAAGTSGSQGGLASFKRGFANREVPAYFCGARLDTDRYSFLTRNLTATSFFPAYRQS